MAFFGKNPICNTVEESFQRTLTFLADLLVFSKNLITKNIQDVGLQILSVGFKLLLLE